MLGGIEVRRGVASHARGSLPLQSSNQLRTCPDVEEEGCPQDLRRSVIPTPYSVFLRVAMIQFMKPQHSSRLRRIQPKFPNHIRRYRLELGLTQREVVHRL